MMTIEIKDINKREISRYLGYRGNQPDEQIEKLIDEVLSELLNKIQPKNIYKIYSAKVEGNKVSLYDRDLSVPSMTIVSHNFSENVKNCSYVVLMAATLGLEADKLLHKYEIINMTKASITQACGAAAIEAYCNKIQEEIRINALEKGLYLRPRFSPGYGDLPLEKQKDIFELLECTKRLGITLTDSLLMYPTKSVTAFIGMTTEKQGCHIAKCSQCKNTECEFRNED